MAGEKKALILCTIVVVGWLLLGTFVYKIAGNCSTDASCAAGELVETEVCGWSLQESFYYSVQAGLSIGFGLLPETEEGSRLYTVFHVMVGSSIVGGILALFMTLAISRHHADADREERILARHCQRLHRDGYKGFKLEELRGLMRRHPRFYRDILELVESDHATVESKMDTFLQMTDKERRKAVDELIVEAHSQEDQLKGGRLSMDQLKELDSRERGIKYKLQTMLAAHYSFVVVWGLFCFWMLLGIIYGVVAEKWSFIQSLYFAVSTCSTGGLQSVTRSPDGWHVLFAAFFALIGVPMYGAALGTFANVIVDRYNAKVFNARMNTRFEAAEVEFVEHINGHRDTEYMGQAEFLELELLKLGVADRDLLTQLRDKFRELDTRGEGKVKKDLLIQADKRRIKRINKQMEEKPKTPEQA
mmetsp:Transcript_74872/g.219341  ORF Transcript_74872/g.219341 Transcript_74872/m.219341 type:complete len:418 (+) Transcript_74872:66-1319(+)